jgi:hypothetical protein
MLFLGAHAVRLPPERVVSRCMARGRLKGAQHRGGRTLKRCFPTVDGAQTNVLLLRPRPLGLAQMGVRSGIARWGLIMVYRGCWRLERGFPTVKCKLRTAEGGLERRFGGVRRFLSLHTESKAG